MILYHTNQLEISGNSTTNIIITLESIKSNINDSISKWLIVHVAQKLFFISEKTSKF